MSGYLIGNGYGGSSDIETSTENQELIPTGNVVYKIKFYNQDACHVLINDITTIYLGAYQGFETCETDRLIYSFKIIDAGVKFNYVTYLLK